MNANRSASRHTLHGHLEAVDVFVVEDQARHAARVGVRSVHGGRQVTLQAAGVPGEDVGAVNQGANSAAVGEVQVHGS